MPRGGVISMKYSPLKRGEEGGAFRGLSWTDLGRPTGQPPGALRRPLC